MSEEKYFQYYPPDSSALCRIGEHQRRKMFAVFLQAQHPADGESLLDVGVTCNQQQAAQNYFEKWYPRKQDITAAGLEDGAFLEKQFPGLRYVRIRPGKLPFADRAFDHVHASAVLEHVGRRSNQGEFLSELWRVCRKTVYITTPNRWFPVELHTLVPVLHWLPPVYFSQCLRLMGKGFFAQEENLNLLSRRNLLTLCTQAGWEKIQVTPVRLAGWTSNWIVTGRKCADD
jgi:ubiquinone/menaquinone biosynthesis C-methylase UbiE